MRVDEFINLVFSPVGGVSVVVTGLAAVLGRIWVGKVLNRQVNQLQTELDSTNRRLQAELDKGLHVHRIQFEKEFRIYEDVWGKLVDLQSAALSLRPELDYIDPKEAEQDRKARRLEAFGEAISQFIKSAQRNRPFFSEEVFQSLETLGKLTHTEAIQYRYSKGNEESHWEKAEKNREAILSQIEVCCKQIRERIGSVKVIN